MIIGFALAMAGSADQASSSADAQLSASSLYYSQESVDLILQQLLSVA